MFREIFPRDIRVVTQREIEPRLSYSPGNLRPASAHEVEQLQRTRINLRPPDQAHAGEEQVEAAVGLRRAREAELCCGKLLALRPQAGLVGGKCSAGT